MAMRQIVGDSLDAGDFIITGYWTSPQFESDAWLLRIGKVTTISWDGSNYPSGIYLVRVKMGEMEETKRLLILK